MLRDAFPDASFKEEEVIAEGDKVYIRWSMTGTNQRPLLGQPATGKKVKHQGQEFLRLKGGKIVERHGEENRLEFFQKLGVAPPP
jgi:predicted ester cyclase